MLWVAALGSLQDERIGKTGLKTAINCCPHGWIFPKLFRELSAIFGDGEAIGSLLNLHIYMQ
jgi:hypothetical protein